VTLTELGAAGRPGDADHEQRLARFLFADVPDGELSDFAATLDHVIARLRDPGFARLRRAALKRWLSRRDPSR
jgi:hypothetical protein